MRKPGSRGMHRNTFSADQCSGTRSSHKNATAIDIIQFRVDYGNIPGK
jgi:hypothetical protein